MALPRDWLALNLHVPLGGMRRNGRGEKEGGDKGRR